MKQEAWRGGACFQRKLSQWPLLKPGERRSHCWLHHWMTGSWESRDVPSYNGAVMRSFCCSAALDSTSVFWFILRKIRQEDLKPKPHWTFIPQRSDFCWISHTDPLMFREERERRFWEDLWPQISSSGFPRRTLRGLRSFRFPFLWNAGAGSSISW